MRFKSQKLAGFIVILLALAMILPVSAFEDEQTRHIELTDKLGADADWFVTEAGLGYSTSLVTITDPNMDIYAYLFFEDMKINYWHHLKNATLRLRTASSMSFDADSSVTIYGVDDYLFFGSGTKGYGPFGAPSDIMNAALTNAYVNLNTSQFYGPQWWEIDVTNIVQELKSNPHWDGPGFVRSDPGDNMGFIILGSGGHDTRYFYDLKAGNGYEAQLKLHWGGSSHPPSGYEDDAVWIEDYGNHTIWEIPGSLGFPLEPMEYTFLNDTYLAYDYISNINGPVDIVETSAGLDGPGRVISRLSNGTLYVVYRKILGAVYHIYVQKSEDNGTTWNSETRISTRGDSDTEFQYYPAMAVDSYDNLHIVWSGRTTVYPGGDKQIWYVKYFGSNGTSTEPLRISTLGTMATELQQLVSIAVDSYDNLHVVWKGTTAGISQQIFYREWDDGWGTIVSISGTIGVSYHPDIAVDSNNSLHVVFWGTHTEFPANGQIWYVNNSGSGWSNRLRVSTLAGMEDYQQSRPALAIDSDDILNVVWNGRVTGYGVQEQTWYNKYDTSWGTPVHLSDYLGMNLYTQAHGEIAIDSSDHLHVLWDGKATGFTDHNVIWYSNYTTIWTEPVCIQAQADTETASIDPHLRWSRWPEPSDTIYLITDLNGTLIMDNGDPLVFDDVEDAKDWIDIYDTDPEDPDPGGEWSEGPGGATGPFTRFKFRLYCLILGFGCLFGPVLFFSWRRPSAYYLMVGAIIMIAGIGLLMFIGDI